MKQLLPLHILFVTILALGNSYAQASTESTAANIPTVDYCELLRNPALYDQKVIRVRTIYVRSGSDTSKFYDFRCDQSGSTWVEFDGSYASRTKGNHVRTLARMERESQPRWGRPHVTVIIITFRRADVIFVGKFEAALPAQVGKEVDFPVLTKQGTDPNNSSDVSISALKTDYAHYYHYQHVFTVQRVELVKRIDPKAPW